MDTILIGSGVTIYLVRLAVDLIVEATVSLHHPINNAGSCTHDGEEIRGSCTQWLAQSTEWSIGGRNFSLLPFICRRKKRVMGTWSLPLTAQSVHVLIFMYFLIYTIITIWSYDTTASTRLGAIPSTLICVHIGLGILLHRMDQGKARFGWLQRTLQAIGLLFLFSGGIVSFSFAGTNIHVGMGDVIAFSCLCAYTCTGFAEILYHPNAVREHMVANTKAAHRSRRVIVKM